MKRLLIALFLLAPLTTQAQNPSPYQNPMGMNESDMQNMMIQMQKTQACMEKVDQSELQALEQKARKYEADMKALCASGDRDEAQEKAITYAKEIMNHPSIKEVRRCGEMMQGAMKGMMQNMSVMQPEKDYTTMHVCDSI